MKHLRRLVVACVVGSLVGTLSASAQSQPDQPEWRDGDIRPGGGPDGRFRGGFPGGPGGPGGPMGQERKILEKYDTNGDGKLDKAERAAAREALKQEGAGMRRGFRGPPGGFGGEEEPEVSTGPRVSKADVRSYEGKDLYADSIVRTIFLDFDSDEWESELEAFHNTDVDVPATMTVDGKTYEGVGVHFRGASSYMMVRAGHKRSLNVSVDYSDPKLRLYGASTLNLLNSHEDPSFMSTVLYSRIARSYIPAPRANFVKVVINGESWGVYVNAEQFNKAFVESNFKHAKKSKGEKSDKHDAGARWKIKGSPMGDAGLNDVGDDLEAYKRRYQIKSADREEDWEALKLLCKTLSNTPIDQLEEKLKPMLDIEGALWFLALDNALINNDGYWIRASDYSLYRDPSGVFHLVPHDMNEAFMGAMGGPGGGPGGFGRGPRRGPGGGGPGFGSDGPPDDDMPPPPRDDDGRAQRQDRPRNDQPNAQQPDNRGPGEFRGPPRDGGARRNPYELDPLTGMNDERKPLRSRLLQVPSLRAKYLAHVKQISGEWITWEKLGPVVEQYRTLIEKDLQADTRKLSSIEAFQRATGAQAPEATTGRRPPMSLRAFADQRSAYLRTYKEAPATTKDAKEPSR